MSKKLLAIFISVLLIVSCMMAVPASAAVLSNVTAGATADGCGFQMATGGGSNPNTTTVSGIGKTTALFDDNTNTTYAMCTDTDVGNCYNITNNKTDAPYFIITLAEAQKVVAMDINYTDATGNAQAATQCDPTDKKRYLSVNQFEIWGSVDGTDYVKLYDAAEAGLKLSDVTISNATPLRVYLNNANTAYKYIKYQGTSKTLEYRIRELDLYIQDSNAFVKNETTNGNLGMFLNGEDKDLTFYADVKNNTSTNTDVWVWCALYDADENIIGSIKGLNNLTVSAKSDRAKSYTYKSSEEGYDSFATAKLFVWAKDMSPIYMIERTRAEIFTPAE